MAKKKSNVKTPDWILEGYDSKADYEKAKGITSKKKGKTFKVRKCPECNSDEIKVKIGEVGVWECSKCKWSGKEVKEDELDEDEFMKYLDEKGEDVA